MPNNVIVPPHGGFLAPSFDRASVADVMHPGIMTCDCEATRAEIAWTMATHRVHCVVVMASAQNGSGEPYPWGIVSDVDLMGSAVDESLEPTARDLAGQPIISVDRTAPLRQAAELMHQHRISHVVVIDEQRPIGILSTLDIAQVLAAGGPVWDASATTA